MASEAFKSNGGLFDPLATNTISGVGPIGSGLASLPGVTPQRSGVGTSNGVVNNSSNAANGATNPAVSNVNTNSNSNASASGNPNLNVLKLMNIPNDLTRREASTIFSLVVDDIINIEVNEYAVLAYFKNYQTCLTTAKLLDGKAIFGKEFGPVKIDCDCGNFKSTSGSSSNLGSAFNNLRLGQQPGTQRSRFLFGDPFSSSSVSHQPNLDLGDLSSQSFLALDSPHDSVVRDPWVSQLGISSAPQTPGTSNHTPLDWNNSGTSTHGLVSGRSNVGNHDIPQSQSQPQSQGDRRRTSSAFFNNNLLPMNSALPLNPINSISLTSGPGINSSSANQTQQSSNVNPSNTIQQGETIAQSLASAQSSSQANMQSSQTTNKSSPSSSIQNGQQSNSVSSSGVSPSNNPNASSKKDVPDLSLLARVPPPANPADQNPPCNTLYVGNLPPDATESELRALFSPQKGFRRLSFRTKNSTSSNSGSGNNHSHGPMCFVEFEDVAHATRALAELYGRTLPRSGASNGKGGIRLSFSKNPLGVRGPGNPRRSSNNQISNSNSSNSNGGIGNYGYSNYNK